MISKCPNANLRLAHWWDSNWEPFNSTCYMLSHWTSIKKLTRPIIPPLFEIKIYWTTTRFFIPPPPPLILEDGVYVMTLPNQLAPKQTANLQTMTAWLQNPTKHLSKDLSLIGCIQMLVPSLSSRNKVLVIAVKNYTKHISEFPYRVRFWLISLLSSKYFVQNCIIL